MWGASTDAVGVTGYVVLRNGVEIDEVDGDTLTVTVTASPGGNWYQIQAVDAAGNPVRNKRDAEDEEALPILPTRVLPIQATITPKGLVGEQPRHLVDDLLNMIGGLEDEDEDYFSHSHFINEVQSSQNSAAPQHLTTVTVTATETLTINHCSA